MVGSFCIASRCLLRRCTCIDRPIGPTSGVASSRPSVARTLPRDRPTDPLLPAAAAALFVPFLRSVRCRTPSSLWKCTYDVCNNFDFGYSVLTSPLFFFVYVTNQIILFFLPILGAQVWTSTVHVCMFPSRPLSLSFTSSLLGEMQLHAALLL